MIDPTITVGNIIEITVLCIGGAVTIGGGLVALGSFRKSVENLTKDMTDMKTEIKEVGKALVTLAVTTTRLDNVEQDIRDMKRGQGFIVARSDGGINGEYP